MAWIVDVMHVILSPGDRIIDHFIDKILGVNTEEIKDFSALCPGDHIEAIGEGLVYYHHGIFLGHDKPKDKNIAEVGGHGWAPHYTSLDSFTEKKKKRLYRINYTKCDPAQTVIARAKAAVDNPTQWGDYNLLTNNCEHFATICKTGHKTSAQVLKKVKAFVTGNITATLYPS